MKQKTLFILLAGVIVLGGAIGGAFAGGMAIGKSQGQEEADQELQSQLESLQSRFEARDIPEGTSRPGFGGLPGRGGTPGIVDKVEGNILTLNTTEGIVRVLIADGTTIQKMGEGSLSDISPGQSITVSGERREDGSVEATGIFVTPGFISR